MAHQKIPRYSIFHFLFLKGPNPEESNIIRNASCVFMQTPQSTPLNAPREKDIYSQWNQIRVMPARYLYPLPFSMHVLLSYKLRPHKRDLNLNHAEFSGPHVVIVIIIVVVVLTLVFVILVVAFTLGSVCIGHGYIR